MEFGQLIQAKYLKNGQAAQHLIKFGEPAPWMLNANGKRQKKYADLTIKTFQETGGKDQERKNFVENAVTEASINYGGQFESMASITGPNLFKHVQLNIRSGVTRVMHVPEINPWTFLFMVDVAKTMPEFWDNKLYLHNCPAHKFKVEDCRFIDLDLMKTMNTIWTTIRSWLKFQAKYVKGKKAFTFTMSLRADGGEQRRFAYINRIAKVLNANLLSVDGQIGRFPSAKQFADRVPGLSTGKGRSCFQRHLEFSEKGRIDEVKVFQYSDGGPMMCFLFLYQ